jgi:hypothetical protein
LYFENDFANFVLLEMFTTRIFLRGAGAGGWNTRQKINLKLK